MTTLVQLELTARELALLSDRELVERLVTAGATLVTALRIVEIERGPAEPSRARRHGFSR
jgi:predicted RNase H-like nuclease (RuvC/YqgF family)